MPFRPLHPGMGTAVFARTVQRGDETWGDVADRVSTGNALLDLSTFDTEQPILDRHISNGNILMSGRHLQHGDEDQPTRNLEVFSNCSTSILSYIKFYLLLNGSGVGRLYNDDLMVTDWNYSPDIRCVLSSDHPDFYGKGFESRRDALLKYPHALWHTVEDSREGWAHAVELYETMAWEKAEDRLVVFDFSEVRPKGSPIGGMQNRPASGPIPLMEAFMQIRSIKGLGWEKWEQAMWVDNYLAECVVVGGVRRSARAAGKHWKDPGIFRYIDIKRPLELRRLHTVGEIREVRKEAAAQGKHLGSFLPTANNAVCVDAEFWDALEKNNPHAVRVFNAATKASYADGTGEPSFLNIDKLHTNHTGMDELVKKKWFGSSKFQPQTSQLMLKDATNKFVMAGCPQFVNPCFEISLSMIGGFCLIGDVVPYHCSSKKEALDAFRAATRALIRTNTMPSIYSEEVKRTNRIGVSITGIHEYAYAQFGYSFRDLIDEEKSQDFWDTLAEFSQAVRDEAEDYSKQLGVACPHTFTATKPAGTTSKIYGLTEGVHLPSMAYYMRWVQFRAGDPKVREYEEQGYPTRVLSTYKDTEIVGFPTKLTIADVIPEDKIVYAGNATPEEQYKWLQLLEKYWIGDRGNQISYTLKYKPDDTPYEVFKEMIRKYQPTIRCCSVMPQENMVSYEYEPEQVLTRDEYEKHMSRIHKEDNDANEDIGIEHVNCGTGGCPVDFRE